MLGCWTAGPLDGTAGRAASRDSCGQRWTSLTCRQFGVYFHVHLAELATRFGIDHYSLLMAVRTIQACEWFVVLLTSLVGVTTR